ncbi:MAG: TolC family protein [Calditrichaeota bacterium]|nr:MAG: TolC family protein [Calditrichota bacterium]
MKQNKILLSALALMISISHVSLAQELLTLENAIAITLKENHSVQVARNNSEISENNAHLGGAGLLPRIDIISSANYSDNEVQTGFGAATDSYTTTTAAIQASYNLFDGFGSVYRYKKLNSLNESGQLRARNQIELSIVEVSDVYFAVAEASENLKLNSESLEISRQRLERAQNRSQYGQTNTIELLSAEVDFNTDSVSYVNAQLALDQAKRELNVLLNRDVNTDFQVNFEVEFAQNLNLANLQVNAAKNNAAYLLTTKNTQQSEFDLKIANSAYLPQLDFQTSYGYNQTKDQWGMTLNDPNRNFTVGLNLSFNLFNGFQNSVNKQNAHIQLKNERILQDEALLNLQSNVANKYQAYQNSLFVLNVQQKNLEPAQLNFNRTKELYELGQVTTTQFREAQLNLILAKNNILSAKYNAKINEIQLLRLSGELVTTNEI